MIDGVRIRPRSWQIRTIFIVVSVSKWTFTVNITSANNRRICRRCKCISTYIFNNRKSSRCCCRSCTFYRSTTSWNRTTHFCRSSCMINGVRIRPRSWQIRTIFIVVSVSEWTFTVNITSTNYRRICRRCQCISTNIFNNRKSSWSCCRSCTFYRSTGFRNRSSRFCRSSCMIDGVWIRPWST